MDGEGSAAGHQMGESEQIFFDTEQEQEADVRRVVMQGKREHFVLQIFGLGVSEVHARMKKIVV